MDRFEELEAATEKLKELALLCAQSKNQKESNEYFDQAKNVCLDFHNGSKEVPQVLDVLNDAWLDGISLGRALYG